MRREVCRCEAWDSPHQLYSGECRGHHLADCPRPERDYRPSSDFELPGMWSESDFLGGSTDD